MLMRRLIAYLVAPIVCAAALNAPATLSAQTTNKEQSAPDDVSRAKLIANALKFRSVGPAFMSGRIGDVAIDPVTPNTWYVAVASGGLWKTTNAGTTFEPIFDNKTSYSMGCVTIDPSTHTTVWLGTGENNGGRHIGFGDGVYVSHDAGKSWDHKGLAESEHISKILVDPRDSDVVFAASQGPLWSAGGQRGLFKSTDGGKNWKMVLGPGLLSRADLKLSDDERSTVNDKSYTGVTDVVFDPANPDVMYAATHQRHRNVWAIINCGPETGIFKSTDGGDSWNRLSKGLPGGDMGKISLQVSPQQHNFVYATIELPGRKGGFWRSDDKGASWTKTNDFVSGGTGPHYYQELWADPHRFGVLYQANNYFMRSEDNGKTWVNIEGRYKHVDNHAVAFHPTDKDFLLVGCDGGVYRSYDYCKTWLFCPNLPLTQFYKVAVDYDYPFYHIAGGTQDNNSQYGPSRTRNVQGIRNSDWQITIGGDGHDTAIDPQDPNIIYAESQQGFLRRFDRQTGESVRIQPQPGPEEESFRFNWDSPILISPHDNKRLYFASQFLHRSDDRGDSWTKVSPDLSRNQNRYQLPTMGRVHSVDGAYDLYAMSQYGNITSIDESPLVEGLLYVGTDDGLIQTSEDGGKSWRKTDRMFDVPESFFVNDIKADLHDADTVYACLDVHKVGDYRPLVVKSHDRGRNWQMMTGDLPSKHLCWRLVQDHVDPQLFFLATEFGIFTSLDAGQKWHKLSGGLPTISFRDLEIQRRENDLVAASFGRSFYVLDDYSLLRNVTADSLENDLHLYPVRRAFWYLQENKLGGRKGYQGDSLYNADNPDYGAVIHYHVKEGWKSKAAKRKEQEAKANAAGSDVPTASFEQLQAEEDEIPPRQYLDISDAAGNVVARLDLAIGQGLHKVVWSMRYQGLFSRGSSPIVAPGTYSAQAYRSEGGSTVAVGNRIEFELESIISPTLAIRDRDEVIKQLKQMGVVANRAQLLNRLLSERLDVLSSLISRIKDHPRGTAKLLDQAQKLRLELEAFDRMLNGDELADERWAMTKPGINRRISNAIYGGASGTYGPTKTALEQFTIGKRQFEKMEPKLKKLLDQDFESLQTAIDTAQIPRIEIELDSGEEED
ncbi:MAG: glycosyl hydrolase [Planctomycetota bacterium]|nr:glycosyl hydrolase [Planctomycetota bacterium]